MNNFISVELSTLKNLMTLEEANEQLKLIGEECKTLKDKLDQVKSGMKVDQ
jgi:cell shape-determining protein MreC